MAIIIIEEFKQFCQTTSIRGVPKIFKSKEIILKIVWTIFVIICTALLVFFLIGIFNKYYQWPVSTRFAEDIKGAVIFPDITICSFNRFANEIKNDEFSAYFKKIQQFKENNVSKKYKTIYNYLNSVSGFIIMHDKGEEDDNDCPEFVTECHIYSQYCQFEAYCHLNFSYIWNAQYPGCYTIRTTSLKVADDVTIKGMSLLLNNGPPFTVQVPYEFYLTSPPTDGVSMMIHSPGTPPDPKRSINLGTGLEYFVRIAQTNIQRLHYPHNPFDCTSQKYMKNSTGAYSRETCIEYCSQEQIYKLCKCVANWFSIPNYLFDAPICGNLSNVVSNETFVEELMNIMCGDSNHVIFDKCDNECLLPCKEINYRYFIESSPWPPKFSELSLYEKYIAKCKDTHSRVGDRFRAYDCQSNLSSSNIKNSNKSCNEILNEIGKSFLAVRLVMEDDFPFTHVDKPVYAWSDMIGIIGGMFSLWLGISVMTSVELLELLYFIVKRYVPKLCEKFKVKPQAN